MVARPSEILAAASGCLMALMACRGILPSPSGNSGEPPLSTYRDSLLDLDMQYPQGWIPDTKKSFSGSGTTYDVFFQPTNTLATRRFTVKIIIPQAPDTLRSLGDFKSEVVERLVAAGDGIRMVDSGATDLGGEPGFQAEYQTFLDGKPYVRTIHIICRRNHRDVGITFETAESADNSSDEDLVLFARVAERFKFYSP
jgi:hypothetical protein